MIGWYVHHQGHGHRSRALAVARHLDRPVLGFSSLPAPPGWPGEWVQLPRDDDGEPREVDAGGVLHFAPLDHRGYRGRMASLARRMPDLDAMVVDVSAEVTLLARLMGLPTTAVVLRGERSDRPHRLAGDAATMLLACWPAAAPEPGWPEGWRRKVVHTGLFSRFDGLDPAGQRSDREVLVLLGSGGEGPSSDQLDAARRSTPGWRWTLRTPEHPSPDLWAELCSATVVVTHAGDGAVGETAAARAPAVVIPQDRPFGEQHATARALQEAGCAVVRGVWPAASEWPSVLADAQRAGADGWAAWHPGDAALRAASAIETLTRRDG